LIILNDDPPLDAGQDPPASAPESPVTIAPVSPRSDSGVAASSEPASPVLPVVAPVNLMPVGPEVADSAPVHEKRRTRQRRAAIESRSKQSSKESCGNALLATSVADLASSPALASSADMAQTPSATGLRAAPAVDPLQSPSTPGLRAAGPRVVSLHVFNLSEDTTVEDVIHHVQTKLGISAPVCEKLVVTRGKYTSFRLEVPADKQRLVRSSHNWPDGVSVRLFNVVQKQQKNCTTPRGPTKIS
jgi:hypothetical protein